MYPKVKVRQQDPPDFQRIYLKDFQYLSLHEHLPNPPEHKDDYTPPYVRVSRSHISSSDAKISTEASKKVDRKVAEENKQNTKPSSVLRPRAVLSSPDNDAMLRTKTETKTQHSGLKSHNLCKNRDVKCKVNPKIDTGFENRSNSQEEHSFRHKTVARAEQNA